MNLQIEAWREMISKIYSRVGDGETYVKLTVSYQEFFAPMPPRHGNRRPFLRRYLSEIDISGDQFIVDDR
jgi:hypothetical protein